MVQFAIPRIVHTTDNKNIIDTRIYLFTPVEMPYRFFENFLNFGPDISSLNIKIFCGYMMDKCRVVV
jgi:hypothetical protein